MKHILFFSTVLCFCTVSVFARSLQLDGNVLQSLEFEQQKEEKLNPKNVDKVIWTRREPNPRLNLQERKENNSGAEVKDFNQSSSEPKFPQNKKEDENLTGEIKSGVDQREKLFLETESQLTNASVKETSERLKDNSTIGRSGNSDIHEVSITNAPDVEMSAPEFTIDSSNFSDSVILNILNLTGNAIVLQSLTDNTSAIESFTFDERALMSEGSEIALLQEVSTIGFELLIDSETKQNLILRELIDSQTILAEDELDDGELVPFFTQEEDSTSDIFIFGLSHDMESKLNSTVVNEEMFHNTENAKFDTNAQEAEDSEFNVIVSEFDVVTDVVNTQTEAPKCPESGWCIFWFLALDTCAKNSHCLGSRICCKSGCSKTCIDVDT